MKQYGKLRRVLSLVLLLAIALMGLWGPAGLADAGDFAGSSDYGGGDSDWGGSSWDDDWDDGYDTYGSYSSSGGAVDPFEIIVVAGIFVVIVLVAMRRGKSARRTQAPARSAVPVQGTAKQLAELKAADPYFSEEAILEKVSNLYVQMQDAWESKQWDAMRPHMTDALFQQFARQLQGFIDKGQTNHVDRIAVLGVQILSYSQDDTNDILLLEVRTRIIDYVTSDATGEIVSGDPELELFMTYHWTLIRRRGVLTPQSGEAQVTKLVCKSCGAPMDVNHTGKCEYCGSIFTADEYDWVISAIQGISRQSGNRR